jgi:hypothetical protein
MAYGDNNAAPIINMIVSIVLVIGFVIIYPLYKGKLYKYSQASRGEASTEINTEKSKEIKPILNHRICVKD